MLALAITAGVSAQQKSEAQAAINNIMTRTSIRQYTDEAVSNGCTYSRQPPALALRGCNG